MSEEQTEPLPEASPGAEIPAAKHDAPPTTTLNEFMASHWGPRSAGNITESPGAPYMARRRADLAAQFPGELLVIPTGNHKVRANDTDFRFRPGTDFFYLVGSHEHDSVLVIETDGSAVLFQAPTMNRTTPAFYADRFRGELWVGPRPSLDDVSIELGIDVRPLEEFDAIAGQQARVIRGFDARIDTMFEAEETKDAELLTFLSEQRLIKDDYEIEQLQEAVDATVLGFEDVIDQLDAAKASSERWIEGVFALRARVDGNDVGYGSICASGAHACTLHWTDNDGEVRDGDLMLLDMGVEGNQLYTADVTRTLPVNGTFSPLQRKLYNAVLEAQEAGLAGCKPGIDFLEPHRAAMRVIAKYLEEWGIIDDAEAVMQPNDLRYRRYTLHGTSHMLGLDVHDCEHARNENYRQATLQPGHVITVEPGLYFQPNDLTVPEEWRGIGIRIEDDIVITEDGYRNLSVALPRDPDEIEAWMANLTN